mmetsp:Transcript_13356/g.30749  ORF Transcript_13356/g.30749 Transcript_13356/m.30749 type:complete len:136 (-) Transcript_13356:145-552(-)|eukprot:763159-Hanusia_phi.AAC.8
MVRKNSLTGDSMKCVIQPWPKDPLELLRGVNDTWNCFQRANKGRAVTAAEWREARRFLWLEYDKLNSSLETSTDDVAAAGNKRLQEEDMRDEDVYNQNKKIKSNEQILYVYDEAQFFADQQPGEVDLNDADFIWQ